MSEAKLRHTFENWGRALDRLEEVVRLPRDEHPYLIDASLQRFKFTLDLAWKAMRRLLAQQGVDTVTPRQTLKQAYKARWLDSEKLWLGMLDDRNRTSHAYDEALAEEIYEQVQTYAPEMRRTYERLMAEFAEVLRPPPPPA